MSKNPPRLGEAARLILYFVLMMRSSTIDLVVCAAPAPACDWQQQGKRAPTCGNTSSCVARYDTPQEGETGHARTLLRYISHNFPPDSSGVCVEDPLGGNLYPQDDLVGRAVFYFPLTGGSLASWPWGTRVGMSSAGWVPMLNTNQSQEAAGASWELDERFGSALACDGGASHGDLVRTFSGSPRPKEQERCFLYQWLR